MQLLLLEGVEDERLCKRAKTIANFYEHGNVKLRLFAMVAMKMNSGGIDTALSRASPFSLVSRRG